MSSDGSYGNFLIMGAFFNISATSGPNGRIVESGDVTIYYGNDKTFVMIPSENFVVDSVWIDGVYVGWSNRYTLKNVRENHTIHVTFVRGKRFERFIGDGWHLLSLEAKYMVPVSDSLYPTASSCPFVYDSYYDCADTIRNGTGYWINFQEPVTISNLGLVFHDIIIPVQSGWNLISGTSDTVPINSITSNPGGMITSAFYGYEEGGYLTAHNITPGKGFWVKVNQEGQLIIDSSGQSNSFNRILIIPTSELPPPPPDEVVSVIQEIPKEYALEQSYPNPFNPVTTIKYQLPVDGRILLKVYNTLGQVICVLKDELQTAGYKSVLFDGSYLSSGIYYCRIDATSLTDPSKTFTQVKKMLLVK